jgi:hypothetical protein
MSGQGMAPVAAGPEPLYVGAGAGTGGGRFGPDCVRNWGGAK